MGQIALVGTLDTKAQEYAFVRDCIQEHGTEALLVNIGFGFDPGIAPDITATEVAKYADTTLEDIRKLTKEPDGRTKALAVMGRGAGNCLRALAKQGEINVVFGMGGGGGTNMLVKAFQQLPRHISKILITTIMGQNIADLVDGTGIFLFNAVTDIAGLNRISKRILSNAAYGAAQMAQCATYRELL